MFEPEPGLIIWTAISFLVLLFLLKRFAYKPLLGFMEERERAIREAIEGSQRTRASAEELLSQYTRQLEESRGEAHKMIEEGRIVGENLKKDILAKASEESKTLLKKVQEEIEKEKKKALVDIQGRVADLSLQIASKVIQKSLKADDHVKLIEDSLAKVREEYGKG